MSEVTQQASKELLILEWKDIMDWIVSSIKYFPNSISTNYDFFENLEGRLVNEQKTVFRHYDTVSEYRQLAAKQMLQ